MVMSQLGAMRLRLPGHAAPLHVSLVLHPGPGETERVLSIGGQERRLAPDTWQPLSLAMPPGTTHFTLTGTAEPFFCAGVAWSTDAAPAWAELDLTPGLLAGAQSDALRRLLTALPGRGGTRFDDRVLVASGSDHDGQPGSLIDAAFGDGPTPRLVVAQPGAAMLRILASDVRWCFLLIDRTGEVPVGTLGSEPFCRAVERALGRGSVVIPILSGKPTERSLPLWQEWRRHVQARLPGLPLLDPDVLRDFHQRHGLPAPTPEQEAASLAVSLRELRARIVAILRIP